MNIMCLFLYTFAYVYSSSAHTLHETLHEKWILCSLWQRKESFMPFMTNCKWGFFYVFYRKVAILNVSKDRFDHSSVYLGEMKLTKSAFLRQLKYTCSSERFLEI